MSADLGEFSRGALEARLLGKGSSPDEAATHASRAHELTAPVVRKLRKEVKGWRLAYVKSYSDIRHKVFAHREISDFDEINALFAKTKVEELKRLFHFLNSLYLALFASYTNGVAVRLDSYDLACTRFRKHRARCFYGTGGESWRDEGLRGSSSLRLCV